MKKVRGILLMALLLGLSTAVFAACADKDGCSHEYDGACDEICNLCGEERTTTTDHDYSVFGKESDYHWKECSVCGAEEPNSQENHGYEPKSGNGQHWEACDCGAEKPNSRANHTYNWKKEGDQHWKECDCGEIDPEHTKTGHVYEWKNGSDKHWKECACGEKDSQTPEADHVYEWKTGDDQHWKECECGKLDPQSPKTYHSYEWKSEGGQHWKECKECHEIDPEHTKTTHSFKLTHDPDHHWKQCECGDIDPDNPKTGHDAQWQKEGDEHWMECPTCGYGADESRATHKYDRWKIEEGTHQAQCVCGEVTGSATAHVYNGWKIEDATHQAQCECGATQGEPTDHNYVWEVLPTNQHTKKCECGKVEIEPEVHNYEWKIENDTHAKVCECGDAEVESAAHTYAIAHGELLCGECSKQGTVNDLTGEKGFENGYVYVDLEAAGFTFECSGNLTETLDGYSFVNVNGSEFATTTQAGEYDVYAYKSDSSIAYKLNGYVATKVIDSVEKMNSLQYKSGAASITGYYILAENGLNYSDKTIDASGNSGAAKGFEGTFNGLGNTISNYTQPNEWKFHSLFGTLLNATVKNVNFENVTVNGYNNSGLFAINVVRSTLENIAIRNFKFAYGPTSVPVHWTSGIFSGAYVQGAVIRNVTVDMNGNRLNAVIGNNSTNTVTGASFEDAEIYNATEVLSIYRENYNKDAPYQFTGYISGMTHAEVYRDNPGLTIYTDGGETQYTFVIPSGTVNDPFVTEGTNNVILKSDKFVVGTAYIVNGKQYTTLVAGELSIPSSILKLGENTVDVAFQTEGSRVYDGLSFTNVILATKIITKIEEMNALMYVNGTATGITGYYVLGNNIDYKSDATLHPDNGTALASNGAGFAGTFNGLGYTIENYTQKHEWKWHSLFGILRGATVKNVKFDNVGINDLNNSALFASFVFNTTIENIEITNCKFLRPTTTALFQCSSGILSGSYVQASVFKNISIDMANSDVIAVIGRNGSNTLAAATFENVNIYNVKNIYHLFGATYYTTAADGADADLTKVKSRIGNKTHKEAYESYNGGIKIYSDNGTTECTFDTAE